MCLCLFFFFFKQKTAYEMRISDWSSDVCSSDLPAEVIAAGADVISHVCYLGYEAQPHMLAAYEDRPPVDETRLAPTGDDPVVAGLYRAMAKRGTILDATGSLFVQFEGSGGHTAELQALMRKSYDVLRLINN